MGVPKRRISKTRKNKRRTHWVAVLPALSKCSNCGQAMMPHHLCPNCGFYRGRQVVQPREV